MARLHSMLKLALIVCGLVAALPATPAFAVYPDRPIKIILAFPPAAAPTSCADGSRKS